MVNISIESTIKTLSFNLSTHVSIYSRMRVENLSSIINWQDLKDIMRRHGEVTFAEAHKVSF